MAELKRQLTQAGLSKEDKAKLTQDQLRYEDRIAAANRDPPEDLSRDFIFTWKIERELHRKYGGRVIFQQFGLEALDARRELFEEAEKAGDLKFDDKGVRHMFYYYANMKHTVVDTNGLEEPWFFGRGK